MSFGPGLRDLNHSKALASGSVRRMHPGQALLAERHISPCRAGVSQRKRGLDDDFTAVRQSDSDKVHKALGLKRVTEDNIEFADLMATIELVESSGGKKLLEEYTDEKTAVEMRDVYLDNDPVFLLETGKSYFLRVRLKHKEQQPGVQYNVTGVNVKPADGKWSELEIAKRSLDPDKEEALALFRPTALESERLKSTAPLSGTPNEKYVTVDTVIDVEVESAANEKEIFQLNGQIVCCMVQSGVKLEVKKFMRDASPGWKQAPRWIKYGACGAVILETLKSRMVAREKTSPTPFALFSRLFRLLFRRN